MTAACRCVEPSAWSLGKPSGAASDMRGYWGIEPRVRQGQWRGEDGFDRY